MRACSISSVSARQTPRIRGGRLRRRLGALHGVASIGPSRLKDYGRDDRETGQFGENDRRQYEPDDDLKAAFVIRRRLHAGVFVGRRASGRGGGFRAVARDRLLLALIAAN